MEKRTSQKGFIKIWRQLEEWEWTDDLQMVGFFVRLILMANWEDKRWHGILIKRGQFVSSIDGLRFGKKKKKLSYKCIRTFIQRLKWTGELATESTNRYTIYTIVNYNKYQDMPEEMANQRAVNWAGRGQAEGRQRATTKEYKELKKVKNKYFSSDSDEIRLSELLFSLIQERNPNHKKPNIQTWAKQIELMMRTDNRSLPEMEQIIHWTQQDCFWQNNILSTAKLREKYDQLVLKMNEKKNKENQNTQDSSHGFNTGLEPWQLEQKHKWFEEDKKTMSVPELINKFGDHGKQWLKEEGAIS